MKRKNGILTLIISFMILLTACGPGEKKSAKSGNNVDISKFPLKTSNNEKTVDGATLKVALVKDSPLVGILSNVLYTDGSDGTIIDNFVTSAIFDTDGNFEVTDTGAATLTVDTKNKKATIKIKNNIKWSDGQPLVAEDIIYSYEVVANKDYTGARYNDEKRKIIGIEDYHNGKASTISGIKKINDKTVEISFSEMGQGIYTVGNGLIGYALPKHYLKDVPIKELQS